MVRLDQTAAWQALQQHQPEVARLHMRDLFAGDAGRFARYSLQAGDMAITTRSCSRTTWPKPRR